MARAKRPVVVHRYEGLERPLPEAEPTNYWHVDPDQTRMARLHPSGNAKAQRKARRKLKRKDPTWTIALMVVATILILTAALIMFLDFRRGQLVGASPPRTIPTTTVSMSAISVDTVKMRLERLGFTVDYLTQTTDPRQLAYETVRTQVNNQPATIMTFKDHETRNRWVEGTDRPVVWKNTWAMSLNSESLAEKIADAMEAEWSN